MSYGERWLVGSVESMMKDAEKGDRLVKITEECMSLLEKHGFLYRMQLHCCHIAVHPSNRPEARFCGRCGSQ